METSDKTARQLYEDVKRNPTRKRFGFGRKPALINIDLQTRLYRSRRVRHRLRDRSEAARVRQPARRRLPRQGPAGDLDLRRLHGLGRGLRRVGHAHQHARLPAEHQGRLAAAPSSTRAWTSTASATSSSTSAWPRRSTRPTCSRCSTSTAWTPWWSPAARPRAACAPRWSTRCRAATAPSFPRSASPTSTRARTSPTSTTSRSSTAT